MKKVKVTGDEVMNINEMINHYKRIFKDRKDCPQFLYALHKTSRFLEQQMTRLKKEYNRIYWELIRSKSYPNEFDGHLYEKEYDSAIIKIEETIQEEYEAFVLESSKKKTNETDAIIQIEAFKDIKIEAVKKELSEKYAAELEFSKELNENFKFILNEPNTLYVHAIVDESYIPTGLSLQDLENLDIIFDIK